MSFSDLFALALESLRSHRLRYGLSALAVAVGVAAVVLLVSIGDGTRRFIVGQMTQFGTTLVSVIPGKTETGGAPGMFPGSVRKLSVDDARALRRLPNVLGAVPTAYGSGIVRYGGLGRRVYVYGVTSDVPKVWSMDVATGQFVPPMDYDRASPVVVLGPKLEQELFGDANALGAIVRIGDWRFRVIGVMEAKGQLLGFDLDDAAYVPVASAMRLFNRPELDEVDLLAASNDAVDSVAATAKALLLDRHEGQEDFTIITQREAQETVGRILNIITWVVTAIAAISLLVGAIGILTIMWIVVQERVSEIGLARAIGATQAQILTWYLFESALTAAVGGLAGLLAGVGGAWLLSRLIAGLESFTSPFTVLGALAMAVSVGLAAGVGPALRAAAMDPVEALRAE